MERPEILSPAGSWETLRAAASAGADAVYFGGRQFNARRNAANFDDNELIEAVSFCHARGMKAYCTLNTLLFQNELPGAVEFVRLLCTAGVDAVIVQDLGIAALIRAAAPGLKLHASTQMSVHSREGVRFLRDRGFSRVVLAREVSKTELEEILADGAAEIEVFVHGALCMSVSGQCYLSAMLGGRSGNRGLCAQPCRLPFSAPGGTGHDLSLKDLSLVQKISELSAIGVKSLKIEGRMKRPEYVAAATDLCLRAAKGEAVTDEELCVLRDVFSRGGFTGGYYEGRLGREMFGARGKEDVLASQSVLGSIRARFEGREYPRVGVSYFLTAKVGEPLTLRAEDVDCNRAQISGMMPEPARTKAVDEDWAAQRLAKTGGTPFFAAQTAAEIGGGLSVPAAELNRMRRDALGELTRQRSVVRPIAFHEPELSTVSPEIVESRRAFRVRIRRMEQLTRSLEQSAAERIFVPSAFFLTHAQELGRRIQEGVRLGVELPRAIFGPAQRKEAEAALRAAAKAGVPDVLCGGYGPIRLTLDAGLTPHADFGLNLTNREALSCLRETGVASFVLSFEASLPRLREAAAFDPPACGAAAYGRMPLMLTRNCPLKNGAGCRNCSGSGQLTDRRGESFGVSCFGGASELLNGRPLWMCDRKEELYSTGIGFAMLYFTAESPEEVDRVLRDFELGGDETPDAFTRGLYYRGVE